MVGILTISQSWVVYDIVIPTLMEEQVERLEDLWYPPALKPSLETMGLSFVAEHCGVVVVAPAITTRSDMSTL